MLLLLLVAAFFIFVVEENEINVLYLRLLSLLMIARKGNNRTLSKK